MRVAGRLTEWNDEKGFGFVMPTGGGARTFVHIKSFERGSRRPVPGDLVSYVPGQDERGRPLARQIRLAQQPRRQSRRPVHRHRAAGGVLALVALVAASLLGRLPPPVAGAYLAMSALLFLLYWVDKAAAGRGNKRTPESTLHLVGLLGGWPGALLAQQVFRHKTVKRPFQVAFWITVVANLAGLWWLVTSGMVDVFGPSSG